MSTLTCCDPGSFATGDPVLDRLRRNFGQVTEEFDDPQASNEGTDIMPRPTGQAKAADTVAFWLPTETGQMIEGHLSEATREEGFRGNIYHIVADDGSKTRLPVHAELTRKLDGIAIDVRAGTVDDWVVVTYTGKDDDETRHYRVEYFPRSKGGSKA
jgi:hypothetical protein